MGILDFLKRGEVRNATVTQSNPEFWKVLGLDLNNVPAVGLESAMTVPSFSAAVSFLSGSMANLPLHVYKDTKTGAVRAGGTLQVVLNEAANEGWSSFAARRYFWQQVFTTGRGLFYIERSRTGSPIALWPIDPTKTTIVMKGNSRFYKVSGSPEYSQSEIIDVPFLLKSDQVSHYSPLGLGKKALGLSLAMGDYASAFFAGGGVPPLALSGPLASGSEATKRSLADIFKAIEASRQTKKPIFAVPPGYKLEQVGFDPEKGQMTDARRFQIEEMARVFNLPPVFLQDLTHGTFSNTEQQDLHLVKHLISQWAKALEDEINLKFFGMNARKRFVEHNLDALQRGDFASRMSGLATGIQNAILTPNEARALENRPAVEVGEGLLVQGATVPLGSQSKNSKEEVAK